MDETRRFEKRSAVLFLITAAVMGICIIAMFRYAVLERERLLEECRKIAWREGVIPSIRGRILDQDGRVLAWTEVRYDLRFCVFPEKKERISLILRHAEKILPGIDTSVYPPRGIIRNNLSPEEAMRCRILLRKFPELKFYPVYERKTHPGLKEKGWIGTIRSPEESVTVGVSGLEEKYDSVLAGTPGKFAVMLDRKGEWVPGTVRIIFEPLHGADAEVPLPAEGAHQ